MQRRDAPSLLSLLLVSLALLLLLLLSSSAASNSKPTTHPVAIVSSSRSSSDSCTMAASGFTSVPNQRPPPAQRAFTSVSVDAEIARIASKMQDRDLAQIFSNCLPNTLDTTVHYTPNQEGAEDTFVVTGDINAMWLRDSTNQVLPYTRFIAGDKHLQRMIRGVVNRQVQCVLLDPYANAFNFGADGSPWDSDTTYKLGFLNSQIPAMTLHLHERKYELDSLCAVLKLSYYYWKHSNDTTPFGQNWLQAVRLIIDTITVQQAGTYEVQGNPPYFFQRSSAVPIGTLSAAQRMPHSLTNNPHDDGIRHLACRCWSAGSSNWHEQEPVPSI
mgnify:FL=1